MAFHLWNAFCSFEGNTSGVFTMNGMRDKREIRMELMIEIKTKPEKLQELPAVKAWLQHAETTVRMVKDHYAHLKGDELFAATMRENVLVQLDHLRTHPAVATRLRRGDLRLHGWVYSIETGEVWVYDFEKKAFVNPSKRKQKAR